MDMFRRENAMVGVYKLDKPKKSDLLVDLRFKNPKIQDDHDKEEILMPSYTKKTLRPPLLDHIA